jgi:hypothetical protein
MRSFSKRFSKFQDISALKNAIVSRKFFQLNLFICECLEKIKKYAFVLENYLQMKYPSISCMMIRNIGEIMAIS